MDVVIGTSKQLREHSHKKSIEEITKSAIEVIEYIKRYVVNLSVVYLVPSIGRASLLGEKASWKKLTIS